MNIIDEYRAGTAPEYAKKHANSNQVLGAAIKARPKTRSADSDVADFNMDLRAQHKSHVRTNQGQSTYDDSQGEFRRTQEEEEYFKAIESFQAAVEDWTGRSDDPHHQHSRDSRDRPPSGSGGSGGSGGGAGPRGSTAASRSRNSMGPSGSASGMSSMGMGGMGMGGMGMGKRSGGSAYTQDVPQILLQTSKRPTAKSSNASPRAMGRSDVRADIRAAYGADDRVASAGNRPRPPHRPSSQRIGELHTYDTNI
jgi:hypothetical protein